MATRRRCWAIVVCPEPLQHCKVGVLTPFYKLGGALRRAEYFVKAIFLESDRVVIHTELTSKLHLLTLLHTNCSDLW